MGWRRRISVSMRQQSSNSLVGYRNGKDNTKIHVLNRQTEIRQDLTEKINAIQLEFPSQLTKVQP